MIDKYIEDAYFEDTGFSYTMSLIEGKYKMTILYCLMAYAPVRYNELKRYLKNVCADGLIEKVIYPQIPPKVEYSLTKRGESLMEVLDQMCIWGEINRSANEK